MSEELLFENAAEYLAFFDEDINEGRYNLYGWQAKLLLEATGRVYTDKSPYEACIAAVNGSGKDRMFIAPISAFLAHCFERSTVVITSASAKQIETQTRPYLKRLCNAVNRKLGDFIFDVQERRILCAKTESVIYLFATDEEGKAEGFHPMDPGRMFCIIANEAKSIPEDIFRALYRCTGYTHRIDISSPGLSQGHFYNLYMDRCWNTHTIDAFDCPHLGENFAKNIKREYGEDSPLVQSMVYCKFGSEDERVLIPLEVFNRCTQNPPDWKRSETIEAGLDLSAGGDETVLYIRNGNRIIEEKTFRSTNTSAVVSWVETLLMRHKVGIVRADAGGLGKPILDELVRRGNKGIVYVYNNEAPADKRAYFDKASENWDNVKHLLEDCSIIIPKDEKLKTQLTTRKCSNVDGERMKLESKRDKKKVPKSPDRADALVLAFANYNYRRHAKSYTPPKLYGDVKEEIFILRDEVKKKRSSFKPMRGSFKSLRFDIDDLNKQLLLK